MSTEAEPIADAKAHRALEAPQSGLTVLQNLMGAVIERGDVGGLERLVQLYREEQDRAAAREFASDFAEFQAECPPVPKDSVAKIASKSGAQFSYSYAQLDGIATHIGPSLHRRGFSYTFDCDLTAERMVKSVCTLRHRNGHSISATFACPVEAAGSMNDSQKFASALTYAKRQSLVMVTGVTTTEPDSDVTEASVTYISEDQKANLRALITDTKSNPDKLLMHFGIRSFGQITETKYRQAVAALEEKALAQRKVKATP
jgi:hypothetical protein